MRAALYARFSSDLQNAGSIGDQLHICRRHAERLGATVVAVFEDAAISGASMLNRPGVNDLVAAAARGEFDVVIAEALDRLTRSGGDAWDLFEDLRGYGVTINTVSEGAVEELAVGLKGTMNALFLRELGKKVHRGLEGVVRSGRYPTAPPYGYRLKRIYDAAGERIRGVLEIVEPEAGVVRRIAAEYLAGSSGHAIAHRLNDEGVVGPRGKTWDYSTIIGRPSAMRGVLRNPIYAGELVWNRQTRRTDRRTGKARLLDNAPGDLVRQPAPELRIVDLDIWGGVQARLAQRSAAVAAAGNASAGNAPRRLLAGLVRCGVCGGGMQTQGPARGYRCVARMRRGPTACDNARYAEAVKVEAEVMTYLRDDLLHPDVVDTFVREYRALQAKKGAGAGARREAIGRELGEVRRRAERLVDQVAEGELKGATVKAKLIELEARAVRLEADLQREAASADVVALHPKAAQRYRQMVEDLQARLAAADASAEADATRHALRQVIRAVIIHPGQARGEWRVEVQGDLTALLGLPTDAVAQTRRAAGD